MIGSRSKSNDAVPGKYVNLISLEGYETYISNPLIVQSASGGAAGTLNSIAGLIAEGSVYSDRFFIQLTDLDGEPIFNQSLGNIMIYTYQQSGQQLIMAAGIHIGNIMDD